MAQYFETLTGLLKFRMLLWNTIQTYQRLQYGVGHPRTFPFLTNLSLVIYILYEYVGPSIEKLFRDEEIHLHEARPPPHYHRDVRAYLDSTFRTNGFDEKVVLDYLRVPQISLTLMGLFL